MKGYIGHTDRGWWEFLRARPYLNEVNFWRPGGGRSFSAIEPGEPFFFRLKSPVNRIGGFGMFSRNATLPVWRVWEVFGTANGAETTELLLDRLARLARRNVSQADTVGCVAVTDVIFFEPDDWVEVPSGFQPQNLSGSVIDLGQGEGERLLSECLDRAASRPTAPAWASAARDQLRQGHEPRLRTTLGSGSFRLAVLDAYDGACAVTGEHSLPAIEAGAIRPNAEGGRNELSNGLPLRRDLHRLFELGYVSVGRDQRLLVSPRLRAEFSNGHTYYGMEGQRLLDPRDPAAAPALDALEWHSDVVFMAA